jgi:hypothetical protein
MGKDYLKFIKSIGENSAHPTTNDGSTSLDSLMVQVEQEDVAQVRRHVAFCDCSLHKD